MILLFMALALIITVTLLIIIITLAYFISPTLSPVPFFPTQKADLEMIVSALLSSKAQIRNSKVEIRNSQIIYDLGAGTGTVIFALAQEAYESRHRKSGLKNVDLSIWHARQSLRNLKNKTYMSLLHMRKDSFENQNVSKFVAIEIHPTLFLWMQLRRLFHPNRNNISIIRADMFKFDLNKLTTDNLQPTIVYLYVDKNSLSRLKPNLLKLPKNSQIFTYMYPLPDLKPNKTYQGRNQLFEYVIQ